MANQKNNAPWRKTLDKFTNQEWRALEISA